MHIFGRYFILVFGFAAVYLLVEGAIYHIPGQIVAALMLLAATVYTAIRRSDRMALPFNQSRMKKMA